MVHVYEILSRKLELVSNAIQLSLNGILKQDSLVINRNAEVQFNVVTNGYYNTLEVCFPSLFKQKSFLLANALAR